MNDGLPQDIASEHFVQAITAADTLFEALPAEWTMDPAWLTYAVVAGQQGERSDKVPVDPATGQVTPPNSPRERGVLSLVDAAIAAEALNQSQLGAQYGQGVVPGNMNPGLKAVFLDFDDCVDEDGTLDHWARRLIGDQPQTYVEVSPSGRGLRIMIHDRDNLLTPMATGVERGRVGLYGHPSRKFVTVTGNKLPEAPLAVTHAPQLVERLLAYMATIVTQERLAQPAGYNYLPGPEGIKEAEQDILDGTSMHPAMVRVATGLHETMARDALVEHLRDLWQRSALKDHKEAKQRRRWKSRGSHPEAVVQWVEGQRRTKTGVSERLIDKPTQQLEALNRMARERSSAARAKAAAAVAAPEPVVAPQEAPDAPEAVSGAPMGSTMLALLFRHIRGQVTSGEELSLLDMNGLLSGPEIEDYRATWATLKEAVLAAMVEADPEASKMVLNGRADTVVEAEMVALYGWALDAATAEAMAPPRTYEDVFAEIRARDMQEAEEEAARAGGDAWMPRALGPGIEWLAGQFWNEMTRPSPAVVTCAALLSVSVASGHFFLAVGRNKTALNLQVMCISGTGTGKDAVQQMLASVAELSGSDRMQDPRSKGGFHQALLNAKERTGSPNLLGTFDEIGPYLRAASNMNRSGTNHLEQARAAMMSIQAMALGKYGADTSADNSRTRAPVAYPYFNCIGFTTHEEFRLSVGERMLRDGWVNRHLIARAPEKLGFPHPLSHRYNRRLSDEAHDVLRSIYEAGAKVLVMKAGLALAPEDKLMVGGREFRPITIPEELDDLIELRARELQMIHPHAASRYGEMVLKVSALATIANAALMELGFSDMRVSRAVVEGAMKLVEDLMVSYLTDREVRMQEGALSDPVERLQRYLRRWRDDPYGHPKEGTHKISKYLSRGYYPDAVLRHVIGPRSDYEVLSVIKAAGLDRIEWPEGRARVGRPVGVLWGYVDTEN